MRLITEEEIMRVVAMEQPRIFYIPEGRVLSPAARDFLNRQLIRIDVEKNRDKNEAEERRCEPQEKPEHMTHLMPGKLVVKDDPRIRYRGKLDSLQAEIVLAQCRISCSGKTRIAEDLEDVLAAVRELMPCEVRNEPCTRETIIGLTFPEIREQSHDPKKFFGTKPMMLPSYKMGETFALLNSLRASVREAELMAVTAFRTETGIERTDIITVLNRLSGVLHIMMCRELSGYYD